MELSRFVQWLGVGAAAVVGPVIGVSPQDVWEALSLPLLFGVACPLLLMLIRASIEGTAGSEDRAEQRRQPQLDAPRGSRPFRR